MVTVYFCLLQWTFFFTVKVFIAITLSWPVPVLEWRSCLYFFITFVFFLHSVTTETGSWSTCKSTNWVSRLLEGYLDGISQKSQEVIQLLIIIFHPQRPQPSPHCRPSRWSWREPDWQMISMIRSPTALVPSSSSTRTSSLCRCSSVSL